MSNETKSAPRRPDFEIDYCRMAVWDNRKEGGHLKFSLSGQLKDVSERIQEAKESSQGERREPVRESGNRSSSRDDRSQRDGGPRYER